MPDKPTPQPKPTNSQAAQAAESNLGATKTSSQAIKTSLMSGQVENTPIISEAAFAQSGNQANPQKSTAVPLKTSRFNSKLVGLLSVMGLLLLASVALFFTYRSYQASYQKVQKSRVSNSIAPTNVDLGGLAPTSTTLQGVGLLQVNGDANITNSVTASSFSGGGADLSNLNATNITSGTLNDARLSPNVALLDANQAFTGSNSFGGSTNFTGAVVLPGTLTINSLTYNMPESQAAGSLSNDGSGNLTWQPSGSCPTCVNNGGNSFGAAMSVGTNDNFSLSLRTNGITRLTFNTAGDATFAGAIYGDGTQLTGVAKLALNNQTFTGNSQVFQNNSNSTSAFSVKNAGAVDILSVDSTNSIVNISNLSAGTVETNTITPTGALTIGSTGQALTLQGNASTKLTATGADTFLTSVGFSGIATGAVTYNFDRSAALGTYNICTSAGNCTGVSGSVGTPGGTANKLAKFSSTYNIVDSIISDNGSLATIGGSLEVDGSLKVMSSSPSYLNFNSSQVQIYNGTTTTNYNFLASGNTTYDICTSSGNCLGGGGGGANTSLSNLASVAINTSLLPGASTAIDLGSNTLPLRDLYIYGTSATPASQNFKLTGAATAQRTITFPDYTGTICTTDGTTAQVCSGYGNNTLSNLGTVALNSVLQPASPGSLSLGVSTLPFSDLYLSGSSATPATNRFQITGTSTGGLRVITMPDATGTICLQASTSCGFAPSTGSTSYFAQNGNSFGATATLGTNDAQSLQFETNNQPAMTIASGGAITATNNTNSTSAFKVTNAVASTIFNVDSTNSRVGIGTAAPGVKFQVGSGSGFTTSVALILAANTHALITQTNDANYWAFLGRNTGSGNEVLFGGADVVDFRTTAGVSGTGLIIKSSGNAGIGTATPGYKLDVNGDINIANGNYLRIGGTAVCGPTATCVGSYANQALSNLASVAINTNLSFASGSDRTIQIADLTSNTATNTLTIKGSSASSYAQDGGAITISGGSSASSIKNGGAINIIGGASTGSTPGVGGNINITAGSSAGTSPSSTVLKGGDVIISGGATNQTGTITSGTSPNWATGGGVTISGTTGAALNANNCDCNFYAGKGGTLTFNTGLGGNVYNGLVAEGDTNGGNGGDVVFNLGNGGSILSGSGSAGNPGTFYINGGIRGDGYINSNVAVIDTNNLAYGTGLLIRNTTSSATGGTYLSIASNAYNQRGFDTPDVEFIFTALAGNRNGYAFVISDTTATGVIQNIVANGLTTGKALSITNASSLTGGNLINVSTASTGNFGTTAGTSGAVAFNFSGAHTGYGFQISDASTAGTTMRINSNSLTTGTAQKISATSLNSTGAALEIDAGTTTSNVYARFIDGATVQGSITNAVGAAVAYNTSSDARLKENIVDTAFGLDSVLAIKVRDYNFISDPNHTVVNGFVAQELYEIYPGAVTVGSDAVDANGNLLNPWGVDYGKLTPLLAKGIQELNTKVDASAAGLSASVLQTLATANAITINGTLTINGVTIFNGNAKFNDEVQFNPDTTGTATIPAGETSIAVTFSKPMSKAPRVTATPQGIIDGSIGVTSKTVTGFTIQLQKAQIADIDVDWQALISQ